MIEITKALVRFQRECPAVIKGRTAEIVSSRTGGKFSYTYADLAGVMAAIRRLLSDCGLFLSQSFETNGSTYLVTTVMHESGDQLSSKIELPINGIPPKEVGSIVTYYRRYSIVSILGIAAEDDDGEAAQIAGVTHGSSSLLTHQLRASVAIESEEEHKNGRHLVPEQYANDKSFTPFIKEIGGKKYWKTTVITGTNENPGLMRQFLHDLEGITDIDELDGLEYDNRTLLQVCQIACPIWWDGRPGSDIPGIRARIEKKRAELTKISKDDPSRYLRA